MLDLVDHGLSRWYDEHAFTASTLTGVLVLLVTVLVADRVVRVRQLGERGQVTAAQVAILGLQGQRATSLVTAALTDERQRDAASDEVRTYMTMLLISAPILIDGRASRAFLEEAQRLGALLSYALRRAAQGQTSGLAERLDATTRRVRAAGGPLVAVLNLAQLTAIDGDADADVAAGSDGPAAA